VDSRAEAEICVEILSQGIGQGESRRSLGAPKSVQLSPDHTGSDLGIRESSVSAEDLADLTVKVEKGHHFFETEVSFVSLESKVMLVGTASPNRRPSSAASEPAKKIVAFCQDNYAEFAKGR